MTEMDNGEAASPINRRLGATFFVARPDVDALDDKRLVWEVVADPVWYRVDRTSSESAQRSLEVMNPGQRAIYATSRCGEETRNGGLHQFFYNSSGVLWRESCEGFRLIGAEGYARILERAALLFPNGEPPDRCEERRKLLEGLNCSSFRAITDGFLALLNAGATNLARLQASYIRSHPDDFFL